MKVLALPALAPIVLGLTTSSLSAQESVKLEYEIVTERDEKSDDGKFVLYLNQHDLRMELIDNHSEKFVALIQFDFETDQGSQFSDVLGCTWKNFQLGQFRDDMISRESERKLRRAEQMDQEASEIGQAETMEQINRELRFVPTGKQKEFGEWTGVEYVSGHVKALWGEEFVVNSFVVPFNDMDGGQIIESMFGQIRSYFEFSEEFKNGLGNLVGLRTPDGDVAPGFPIETKLCSENLEGKITCHTVRLKSVELVDAIPEFEVPTDCVEQD